MSVQNLLSSVYSSWSKCLPFHYGDGTYAPKGGITYCNDYVHEVCLKAQNYKRFVGFLANEIYDYMENHPSEWTSVSGVVAQQHANDGGLVIAAWQNESGPHGHVSIVIPGVTEPSAKWNGADCPTLANVGELPYCKIGITANWAFGQEPKYFVLNVSL